MQDPKVATLREVNQPQIWTPPPRDVVKINFDVAVSLNRVEGVVAVVVRIAWGIS